MSWIFDIEVLLSLANVSSYSKETLNSKSLNMDKGKEMIGQTLKSNSIRRHWISLNIIFIERTLN